MLILFYGLGLMFSFTVVLFNKTIELYISPDAYHRSTLFHVFEPTCAYARWALMHHFPSVWRLLLDQNSLDKNSYLRKYCGVPAPPRVM